MCWGILHIAILISHGNNTSSGCAHHNSLRWEAKGVNVVNAPATFERLIELVLSGLQWQTCLVYLDDILVYSSDFQTHIERLEEVLLRLEEAGLKLKASKCSFLGTSTQFLGHVVSAEGISTCEDKIEAVKSWPVPKTVSQVRSFLGLSGYYRRFCKDFSIIARPLYALTEKGASFRWTDECEAAFQKLKDTLATAPVLAYFPDSEAEIYLDCDASNDGAGAVLSAMVDGQERVIGYFSKTFNKAERSYCTTRKELAAIVFAVKFFHIYLYGRPKITVRTDHQALIWLSKFKSPEGQLARWIQTLDMYRLDIQYRPGKNHANADSLSRRPCTDCSHCDRKERQDAERAALDEDLVCSISLDESLDASEEMSRSEEPYVCPVVGPDSAGAPWLTPYDHTEMRDQQQADPELRWIVGALESGVKPTWEEVKGLGKFHRSLWTMWSSLTLVEGVLYRREAVPPCPERLMLVAPGKLRKNLFEQVHNHRLGGHFGVSKTFFNLRKRFWWVGMRADVRLWTAQCDACQRRGRRPGLRMTLKQEPVGWPMERVAMDILSFTETTDDGNCCVLVVCDYFSKWTEAFALPAHDALTVADVLVTEFFLRFGTPRVLHSDGGPEFRSKLIAEICRLLDIKKSKTAPYGPQADAIVERFNQTLIALLSKFCAAHKKTWDTHLAYVVSAYRATCNESIGCTPNLAFLGREVTFPIDLMYPHPQTDSPFACVTEYVEWVKEAMKENFEFIRENLGVAATRQKHYYDKRAVPRSFKVGSWVLRFYPPNVNKSKLNSPWVGPYLILKQLGEVDYVIQRSEDAEPLVVHVDHLKQYLSDPPPTSWLPTVDVTVPAEPSVDSPVLPVSPPAVDAPVSSQVPPVRVPQPVVELVSENAVDPVRRGLRERHLPSKFKNFALYNMMEHDGHD